jgi:hypothetical protein
MGGAIDENPRSGVVGERGRHDGGVVKGDASGSDAGGGEAPGREGREVNIAPT